MWVARGRAFHFTLIPFSHSSAALRVQDEAGGMSWAEKEVYTRVKKKKEKKNEREDSCPLVSHGFAATSVGGWSWTGPRPAFRMPRLFREEFTCDPQKIGESDTARDEIDDPRDPNCPVAPWPATKRSLTLTCLARVGRFRLADARERERESRIFDI